MTKQEQDLIQALRLEMQSGFSAINENIKDLTAQQEAHLAVHRDREKQQDKTGVTRRWVVGVVISACFAIPGVLVAMMKILNVT